MITEILSALLQITVFTLIPFIVYLIQKKKINGFFKYIGLVRSNAKANILGVLIALFTGSTILLLAFFNPAFKEVLIDPTSVTGKIRQMGFGIDAVLTILIIALFKTALAEEILFRGFLAKRLIKWLEFQAGNIIQSAIFGIIHSLLFMSITDNILFLIVIFIFPSLASYLKTYVNEKVANGSIVPGWVAHATGNVIAYSTVGFFF